MKKTIAMILMLVTILSLCACGAKEPAQSIEEGGQTQQETTMPEEPKIPNLDMFEGKWNIVDDNSMTEITTLVINADGTIEANGETLTWTAEKAHPNSGCEMILEVNYPADPNFPNSEPMWAFEFRLARTPENTYVAEMRKSQTAFAGDQFYREGDYEVIALTDENAMEYLEQLPAEYTFDTRPNTTTTNVYKITRVETVKFKDGVGALTTASGALVFETTCFEVRLTDDATNFVEGDVLYTDVDEVGKWANLHMEYFWKYEHSFSWYGEPGSSDLQELGKMKGDRLIGTSGMQGYVFIPV